MTTAAAAVALYQTYKNYSRFAVHKQSEKCAKNSGKSASCSPPLFRTPFLGFWHHIQWHRGL